jgi:hypothetical protein
MTQQIWDYDEKELEKTEQGRIRILERMINFGPGKKKIKLIEVKKYWDKLHLFHLQKRLFEILLWEKYNFTQKDRNSSLMK